MNLVRTLCGRRSLSIALGVAFLIASALPIVFPQAGESFTGVRNFEKSAMSNKPFPEGSETEDGASYYVSAITSAEKLNDYVVDSSVYTYRGTRKPVLETCTFYFKRPAMIRVEVDSAGMKSGSILVVDRNHHIEARPGSFLKFVKLDLSPSSKLLETANGFSMLQVDFATLLRNMKEQAEAAGCLLVLAKSAGSPGNYANMRHLEFVLPSNEVLQRIAFDDANKLPVEWTLFRNGKVFSTSVWSSLRVNQGLPDGLFSLK